MNVALSVSTSKIFLRATKYAVVIGVGVVGLVLRLCLIADLTSIPGSDEVGYLAGGLLLLEGLVPGFKHVPSAVITWLVVLCTGVSDISRMAFRNRRFSRAAAPRPLTAMERVLFGHYADMTSLRLLIVILQTVLGEHCRPPALPGL